MSTSRALRLPGVLLLAACIGACTRPAAEPEEPAPTAPAEDIQALAHGNNAFAVDLYKRLAEKEGNVIFSPYSIRTALAMTYAGARGKTAEEMRKVLHFTLPDERLHPAAGATAHQLKGGKERQYELNVANALWGQKGFAFRPEFLDLTRKNYAAGFREADFRADPESARREINRWVEEKTQDRIKELLKPKTVTPQTRLVLVNAIYFKGEWAQAFDPRRTADGKFRVTPEQTVPVRMMSQHGKFGYAEMDDAQFLRMDYRSANGAKLAMVVALPKEVDGLSRLEAKLNPATLQKWVGLTGSRRGTVALPRFKVEKDYGLKDQLMTLGMPSSFGPEEADFGGITPEGNFFIGAVIHKAMAEVNEEGTVAAAATAVVGRVAVSAPAPPFVFCADHPFLYAIVDRSTGTVLFLGRFVGPQ